MRREYQPPKVEKFVNDIHRDSVESHPAYAEIAVSRVHGHEELYASEFKHNDYIVVRLHQSDVKRNLSNDWHHSGNELIEVAMSESQWARFISTPNAGGTPCTLQFFAPGGTGHVPGIVRPTDKREQFVREASDRLDKGIELLRKLETSIDNHKGLSQKSKDELTGILDSAITEMTTNIGFVADQFGEHVEAVTNAAQTEIHAYIENAISRAGLRAIAAGAERPFDVPSFAQSGPVVKTFPEPGDEQ